MEGDEQQEEEDLPHDKDRAEEEQVYVQESGVITLQLHKNMQVGQQTV